MEQRAIEQMLVRVSTRRYPRSLEPLPVISIAASIRRSTVCDNFLRFV
jgi:hypothetical protein